MLAISDQGVDVSIADPEGRALGVGKRPKVHVSHVFCYLAGSIFIFVAVEIRE
jgi:hypothetical protein